MDFLKSIFSDKALTYAELEAALKDNKEVKLANLASGRYVDKEKFDTEVGKLATANKTISGLQEAAKKFDGVDVEKLKQDFADLQTKYDTDTAAIKLGNAIELALRDAKVKNPRIAKNGLDMSLIKMDGDTVLGLKEQLDKLRESDGYLFEPADDGESGADGNGGQGGQGGAHLDSGGSHGSAGNPDYDKMSDDEYYKAMEARKKG